MTLAAFTLTLLAWTLVRNGPPPCAARSPPHAARLLPHASRSPPPSLLAAKKKKKVSTKANAKAAEALAAAVGQPAPAGLGSSAAASGGGPAKKASRIITTPTELRDVVLAEAARDERDVGLLDRKVGELEALPPGANLPKALLGNWKLAFASAAEPVEAVTTGTTGTFSVTEGVMLTFQKTKVLATEAVRRFGVAGGNSKLVQVGRYTLDGSDLGLRFTYYLDGNGAETERSAAHSAVASHCSSDLLVLRFPTRAYLIFARLAAQSDVDKALDEWGVGPNAEKMDEEAKAKKDAGPQLPDLKDVKLPGDLKLPELPKDIKLPTLPDVKLPWD